MKVLAVFPGNPPCPVGTNGGPIVAWAVVRTLQDAGHEVAVCTFNRARAANWNDALLALEQAKIPVTQLSEARPAKARSRLQGYAWLLRRVIAPRLEDFYPTVVLADEMSELVRKVKPDVLYLFTPWAVAPAIRIKNSPPRVAVVVDLDHIVLRERRRYRKPASRRRQLVESFAAIAERNLPRMLVDMLRPCELVIEHAAHHAEWLRQKGLADVRYLPNPVLDGASESGGIGPSAPADPAASARPRIVLLGHLEGISTLAGLYLMAEEILPELERLLGADGFEVRLIGKGELPPRLADAFARPSVVRMGFVPDLRSEMSTSNVFLVPTPIELGVRTRIAEAFSMGACVVAHSANQKGMPEMVDGKNALLADTGKGLARVIARAVTDSALRIRLGNAGRATFEEELDGKRVCQAIVKLMEGLVSAG